MSSVRICWLGRTGYGAAVELQEELRRRILAGDDTAETVLLCEHDPVITLGRAAQAEHVLLSPDALARRGVELVRSTRGGDVTYHGPGQLVLYPVMRLQRGVVAHVQAMADAAIALGRAYGIEAQFRRECPGVWVNEAKLAAFGVHVHRRVAVHGMALNVTTALDAFDWIVPCGLRGTRATSLAELASASAPGLASLPELARVLGAHFARAIGREPIEHAADAIRSLHSRSVTIE